MTEIFRIPLFLVIPVFWLVNRKFKIISCENSRSLKGIIGTTIFIIGLFLSLCGACLFILPSVANSSDTGILFVLIMGIIAVVLGVCIMFVGDMIAQVRSPQISSISLKEYPQNKQQSK